MTRVDIHILNPITYPNWDQLLLDRHDHSFFHTSIWTKVLQESYGFIPLHFAAFDRGRLSFLMPFMEVGNAMTGKRGVSLPFTDRCALIVPQKEMWGDAVKRVIEFGEKSGWKSVEWRDAACFSEDILPSELFYTHDIDLKGTDSEMAASLSRTNRRNIRKAVKVGVTARIGRSEDELKSFYHLNCLTRKRHGLPSQPYRFFKKVFEHIISPGHGIIVTAMHSGKTIAASMFFHFGKSCIFKYGASDYRYQILRPNNLVLWEGLQWYRQRDFETMSLGRTDTDNTGLLRHKRMWGAKESMLTYYRYDIRKKTYIRHRSGIDIRSRRIFARAPLSVLRLLGRLLYRHMG